MEFFGLERLELKVCWFKGVQCVEKWWLLIYLKDSLSKEQTGFRSCPDHNKLYRDGFKQNSKAQVLSLTCRAEPRFHLDSEIDLDSVHGHKVTLGKR